MQILIALIDDCLVKWRVLVGKLGVCLDKWVGAEASDEAGAQDAPLVMI